MYSDRLHGVLYKTALTFHGVKVDVGLDLIDFKFILVNFYTTVIIRGITDL